MNYIKKAKSAMKDVQDLQKGFKEMGLQFDKKGDSQPTSSAATPSAATPSAASPPPSTTASVMTPPSTRAVSEIAPSIVQGGDLSVPRCPNGSHLTKIPLNHRKNLRDKFESTKSELEKEFSDLLGVPWTVHADAAGIYTYTENSQNVGSSAKDSFGSFIHEYFDGAISSLKSFKEKYGVADVAIINQLAPTHTVTLEPTTDEKFRYNTTDFHEGRWRLLFRDINFGVNIRDVGENLSDVVNAATQSGATGAALSLNAQKSIRDRYEKEIGEVEGKARTILNAPTLTLHPNFESNYATLAAFKAVSPDKLRDNWDQTLGPATLEYFQGFVSQLERQKFAGDDMMQEGFQDIVDSLQVALVVTPDVKASFTDCAIEGGVLIIRAKPSGWWTNSSDACEELSKML